jgi:hypothetical protein
LWAVSTPTISLTTTTAKVEGAIVIRAGNEDTPEANEFWNKTMGKLDFRRQLRLQPVCLKRAAMRPWMQRTGYPPVDYCRVLCQPMIRVEALSLKPIGGEDSRHRRSHHASPLNFDRILSKAMP